MRGRVVGAERTARVQALGRLFVRHYLGPGDLVAVAFTSGRTRGFTANRSSLLGSIDQFMGKKSRSSTLDRLQAQAPGRVAGTPVIDNRTHQTAVEGGHLAAKTLKVLKAHCEWLKTIRGRRKALIWISENLDYDISNVLPQPYSKRMLRELPRVLDEAARANVAIYALDPGGLNAAGDNLLQVATGSGPVVAPSGFYSILAFPDDQPSLGTTNPAGKFRVLFGAGCVAAWFAVWPMA